MIKEKLKIKFSKNLKVWSLYRGMSSPLIGSMFINSILFGVESNVRKNLDFEKATNNSERYKFFALSGAIAGFVQGVLLTPIEIVKIKMQLENSKYRSTMECVKDYVNNKGAKSLTRGFLLTIYRETPACSLYFVGFEMILDSFEVKDKKHKLWHLLSAGGLAGCISWTFTYPIDVVKTRYQADSSYKGMKACLLNTYKTEGLIGFWRGLPVALMRY
jgi:solute carrier family 25 carnitine/acylcarnitine transporter 20/29